MLRAGAVCCTELRNLTSGAESLGGLGLVSGPGLTPVLCL